MNFYAGTLGQLVIVEAFVFWIWLRVFLVTATERDGSLAHKKLMLTALGLVLTALAIGGIMAFRIYELITGHWPFVWAIVSFYVVLAVGGFLIIVSASIGENLKPLKLFLATSAAWTAFVVWASLV